uniref:Hemoglobin, beta adult 2 n=1 Tax=Oryzias sinensis TaxID=183150 RepID=A0A8C7Z8S7_9TELE
MVKWTEEERCTIRDVWEKVDIDEIGPQVLTRQNIISFKRHTLATFGDIFTNTSILNNPKVAHRGKVVLRSIDKAVRNMDRIQETHAALSRLHYEGVDPDNFKLLGDCITITIACKLKEALNPQVQAVWQKFLCAVVESTLSIYH